MASTSNEISSVATIIEGRLTSHYKEAVSCTINKYFSYFKFSLFKEKYPEIYEKDPDQLKNIHGQLLYQLKTSFLTDVEQLVKDADLFSSLGLLEEIIKEGNAQNCSWRPSGDPKEAIRDAMHQVKLMYKERLNIYLANITSENASLQKTVTENDKEIIDLKTGFHDLDQKLKHHFSVLNDPSIMELEQLMHTIGKTDIEN